MALHSEGGLRSPVPFTRGLALDPARGSAPRPHTGERFLVYTSRILFLPLVTMSCRLMRRPASDEESVLELQQQLHEKDMKLTDIRLEALSSAHQLEQLRDTMNQMKVHRCNRVCTRDGNPITPELNTPNLKFEPCD